MRTNAEQFIAALKFVSHAVAKNEVRYYLKGVHMELYPNEIILVATDGHRMAHLRMDAFDGPVDRTDLLITAECVKGITSMKPGKNADITLGDSGVQLGGMSLTWEKIDGTFPDWRRVQSTDKSKFADSVVGVNMQYVEQASKAALHITNKKYKGATIKLVSEIGVDHGMHIDVPSRPEFTFIREAKVRIMGMRL